MLGLRGSASFIGCCLIICVLGLRGSASFIGCCLSLTTLFMYVGGEAIPNVGFGVGTGSILASNVSCNGYEYSLGICPNITDIPAICTHDRDAAASCQAGFSELLR